MAIRGTATTAGANSSTASVAVPTGVQSGDIVILTCTVDRTDIDLTTKWPANFVNINMGTATGDGQRVGAAYKRLTGADSGSYTLSGLGFATEWICQAIAFSGRHATNNPVASLATDSSANTSPVSVNASTVTALSGDDLVMISGPDVSATGVGNGHTPPAGYTEATDAEQGFSNLSIAYKENVSAGATGTVTASFALTSGNSGWVAFLIRIPSASSAQDVTLSAVASAFAAGTAKLNENISCTGVASVFATGTAKLNQNITAVGGKSSDFAAGTLKAQLTVQPAGVSSAFAAGALTVQQEPVITWSGASEFAAGALTVQFTTTQDITLTGVASAFAAGTLNLNQNIVLTGVASAFAAGAQMVRPTVQLTGVASGFAAGTLVLKQNINLTGVSSAFAAGALTVNGGTPPPTPTYRKLINVSDLGHTDTVLH